MKRFIAFKEIRQYKCPQSEHTERQSAKATAQELEMVDLIMKAPRNKNRSRDMPLQEELGRRYPKIFTKKGYFRIDCTIGQIRVEDGGLPDNVATHLTTMAKAEKAAAARIKEQAGLIQQIKEIVKRHEGSYYRNKVWVGRWKAIAQKEEPEDLATTGSYEHYMLFTKPQLQAQLQKRKLTAVGDKEVLAKRPKHNDEYDTTTVTSSPRPKLDFLEKLPLQFF